MKTLLRYRAFAVGMISLLAWGSFAEADNRLSSEQVVELVVRGEIVSVQSLQLDYPELLSGRWLDIELEHKHDLWVYEFEVIDPDGVVTEYKFNAQSGELMSAEIED